MIETQPDFHKRVASLGRKHEAMSHGYTTSLRSDGLIIVKPRRAARRGFPVKGLLGLVVGFFVFKALLLASLGEITYNERVARLDQGVALERAGSRVMQIDPVTAFMAGFIDPLLD